MIFKKLKLKNFMSYVEAEIDFSGLHTACLCGANGAGKSSLLDAVTWTLWEEGRARTDDLIKLGTKEMSCELEFFMEENLYRVYRSRAKHLKNSQGKSNLEFQIFNEKESTWVSISKSSVRQTQELIINTLRMDHKTFVNSVYLKQGKADEFTTKKPTERKQILSDILGMHVYDQLNELARKKVRDIEQNISIEERIISDLKIRIERKSELEAKQKETSEKVKNIEANLEIVRASLSKKEKELNSWKYIENYIITLERSKQNQEMFVSTLEGQLKSLAEKEKRYIDLLSKKDSIEKEYNEFNELKKTIEEYENKKETYNKLLSEKNTLEHKLKDEVKQAEKELAIYKAKITDRDSLKNNLLNKLKEENRFLSDFLPQVENVISKFQALQESLISIELAGQALKNENEILKSEVANLSEKENEIKEKISILNSHKHEMPCPLCKGKIKDKNRVISAYEQELKACLTKKEKIGGQINLKEKDIEQKRKEYVSIKNEVTSFAKNNLYKYLLELEKIRQEKIDHSKLPLSDSVKAISYFQSQLEVSRNEFKKIRDQVNVIDKELNNFNSEFESLKALLDGGELVKEISKRLYEIEKEISKINFNEEEYIKLKSLLKTKESIFLTYNLMLQAEKEISEIKGNSEELKINIEKARKEILKFNEIIQENKTKIGEIGSLENEVINLKGEEKGLSDLYNYAKRELIIVEQELNEIAKSREMLKEKESKIGASLKDKEYFEKLEKAFSKNGIQIAIIETVVPELEKEANKILNALTDNRMHVALRTQKEKKRSDGLIETLDVIIADSAGTRSYELYSGGEAFKIDFALRLALSRFLANRAGSRLQTLIIDEGFGSQDSAGKERLVEVIKSIENEFELMLIVTHLDELKESFPAQIRVYKDEEGSHVELAA